MACPKNQPNVITLSSIHSIGIGGAPLAGGPTGTYAAYGHSRSGKMMAMIEFQRRFAVQSWEVYAAMIGSSPFLDAALESRIRAIAPLSIMKRCRGLRAVLRLAMKGNP